MKRFVTSGLSVAALAAVLAVTSVAPASAQWRRGGGWRGPGIGAGIVAGALIGGAIAGSRPYYGDPYYAPGPYYAPAYGAAPVYEDAGPGGDGDAYCAQRYRSYDPSSGTFLGFDGARHPCP